MTKIVPIDSEIRRVSKLMDQHWDNPKGETSYELFLEDEYNRLIKSKREGELWYVPF